MSNSFGNYFKITTFGESHGPGIGVTIDGCPAGLRLDTDHVASALKARAPGQNELVTPRKEHDAFSILSGVYEGVTTGAPLTFYIANKDADSSKYEAIKHLKRPGHANTTYLEKYGIFDHRGGGRASARETAARVAAGAVAKQILAHHGIKLAAYLSSVAEIHCKKITANIEQLHAQLTKSTLACPCAETETAIRSHINEVKLAGDSVGGTVGFLAENLPIGLGEPLYDKLEARLAFAMLSIPATKGFEIGNGFASAKLRGSENNDAYLTDGNMASNHAGGVLGGISNGMPLYGCVAFKPTSSIQLTQQTTTLSGESAEFKLPEGSRHDPCVALRGVAVVEAMLALVLVDCLLATKLNCLE